MNATPVPLRAPRAGSLAVALLAALCALALLAAPHADAAARTTWLCSPSLKSDPCRPSLATTQISPTGTVLGSTQVTASRKPAFDCFYVYPTVSNQPTPQATLKIDPEERSIALYQASRYSKDCRVYAPMYRQITIQGLLNPKTVTATMQRTGYADVVAAWREYLKHDNKGRGVVLIGHSQGSFVLRSLIAKEIDPKPTVRRRLISAILLGGNVVVKKGSDHGGDFKNVRACHSATQIGCVVAFSTFNATPPANSLFGRASVPIAGLTKAAPKNFEVLCTNPAALGGGSAPLDSIYPTTPFAPGTAIGALVPLIGFPVPAVPTQWLEAKGAYTGQCSSDGGARVLRIAGVDGAPVLKPLTDATWGLHLADANIALGNLTALVESQAKAYLKQRR